MASAKTPEIAVVVKIAGIPWYNIHEEGVKQAAQDLGVNAYQVGPANADAVQQVRLIEDLIAKHVDAITVTPNDAAVLAPTLQKARDAGIVVITNESPGQDGANWDIELTDRDAFAEKIFKDLAECMGHKGKFAIFVGSLEVPLHNYWADVGLKYIKDHEPNMSPATDRFGVAESVDDSRSTTLDLLKRYPDLGGIAAMGSLGPIGAGQALTEQHKNGKVCVTGTVIPSQGLKYLQNGAITRGTLWSPKSAGYALVATSKAVLDGTKIEPGTPIAPLGPIKKVDAATHTILFDGTLDITKDNAKSFGF